MGVAHKPPFYDYAVFWLAFAAVVEVIGGFIAQPSLSSFLDHPEVAWTNRPLDAGLIVIGLGLLLAGYSLVLFLAHLHIASHASGTTPPGTVIHNYNAPVTMYGVQSTSPPVQNVPGGVQTAAPPPIPAASPPIPAPSPPTGAGTQPGTAQPGNPAGSQQSPPGASK